MHNADCWPALPLREWQDTYRTLHMWAQIVGKIRLNLAHPLNHWWHVTLYVNARGLTTGPIPYASTVFEIQFDFQKHVLLITTGGGRSVSRPFRAESVADFYHGLMEALRSLGISVEINLKPQEVPDPISFDLDQMHASYDSEYAHRFWRILVSSAESVREISREVSGQVQPSAFFLGEFRPGGDAVFGTACAAAQGSDQRAGVFA